MRIVRYLLIAVIGIVLLVVASANRAPVTLNLLPGEMTTYLGRNWSVQLPLFLVILTGVAAGVLLGFVWEWLREHKHRATAAQKKREASQLQREVAKLKTAPDDDVLALLDDKRKAS